MKHSLLCRLAALCLAPAVLAACAPPASIEPTQTPAPPASQELAAEPAATQAPAAEEPAPTAEPDPTPAEQTPAETDDPWAVDSLTLEEKVGQLFLIRPDALDLRITQEELDDPYADGVTELTATMQETLAQYPVGGVVLFGKNLRNEEQIRNFTAELGRATRVPMFIGVDEEGGTVSRLAKVESLGLPQYESAAAVGAQGPDAVRDMSVTIGGYLKDYGFNLDFAPDADVNTNPDNPVIGTRAFSSDPDEAAASVRAAVEGFNETGVLCSLKHFPGHGDTAEDSHLGVASTTRTLDEMRGCEFKPFAAGIEAGVPMVMVGHITAPNAVPAEEAGLPATFSHTLVTDVLRNELGFDGLIVTDSMAMGAITENYTAGEAALAALEAGVDLLLMPAGLPEAFDAVVEAVETGVWPESELDARVERVLAAKRAAGLL